MQTMNSAHHSGRRIGVQRVVPAAAALASGLASALPALTAAVSAALTPAAACAQSNQELLQELRTLRARVDDLEKKLAEKPAPAERQWGMTPEQQQEFNRIAVKTEALEDNQEAFGFKGLKIGGYIDPVYIWNKDRHRSGFQFVNRVSDDGYTYYNGYFGTASLDIQKEMEGGSKFRLTLMPNRGAGSIADPDGNSIVHEASFSIPLGDLQTRIIGGQIPDWSGYEYIQATQTKLVTRGLLLDFTEPTVYLGAGMELIRGKWDMKALVANYGTTRTPDGRLSPVLAYRVDYSKGEFSGFGFAGMHGRIANFSEAKADFDGNPIAQHDSWANLFEVDGYYTRGDLTLQGQVGVGRQNNAAITPAADGSLRNAKWWAVSGLAAYKFIPRWEATARADFIGNHANGGGLLQYSSADDRNGIGPDGNLNCGENPATSGCSDGANRYAIALGLSYALTANATIKTEYRYDGATQPVFYDLHADKYRKGNHLLGTSVVVFF